MKQILILLAVIAYLLSVVFPNPALHWVISLLSLLVVILHIFYVKRFVQTLGGIFLLSGALMLIYNNASWKSFLLSFGTMLNILSLFALLPFIALPIELGNYASRVRQLIRQNVHSSGRLYVITSGLSYLLSSFMNLATLPMIYHSIRPSLDLFQIGQKERFMSRAITHGYSMPILWTPVAPIVGIIIEMTGVSWNTLLPVLIPLSLLGLAVDCLMGVWIASRRQRAGTSFITNTSVIQNEAAAASEQEIKGRNPIHILVAILVFNAIIFLLELKTRFNFLFLVAGIVIPFAFIWSVWIGEGRRFISTSIKSFPGHLIKMREQFVIFLCAGFFISAIQITGMGHSVNLLLMSFKDFIGADLFVLLIPFIPLTLAFIGLHPAVGLALTAESLNPQLLGISDKVIAIAMLAGAATAFLMGPYNATAGIMANLVKESPYRVSNWNAPFTLVYLLIITVVLMIMK